MFWLVVVNVVVGGIIVFVGLNLWVVVLYFVFVMGLLVVVIFMWY